MAKALVVTTGGEVTELVLGENSLAQLQKAVGGLIDCIRGEDFAVYVHDEGLLLGLPQNATAEIMTQRFVVGDVVFVGTISPEGKYDGADYDLPPAVEAQVRKMAAFARLWAVPEGADT